MTTRIARTCGLITLGIITTLGVTACSSDDTASSTSSASTAVMASAQPQAGTAELPPVEVSLDDASVRLKVGQTATWTDVVASSTTLLLSGDPTVFVTVPVLNGEPLVLEATGPGTAIAKVYIDSGQPAQILDVTVTAE